jgi:hypothetical protein
LTSSSRSTASRATQRSRKQQQATLSPRLGSSAPTKPRRLAEGGVPRCRAWTTRSCRPSHLCAR